MRVRKARIQADGRTILGNRPLEIALRMQSHPYASLGCSIVRLQAQSFAKFLNRRIVHFLAVEVFATSQMLLRSIRCDLCGSSDNEQNGYNAGAQHKRPFPAVE